MTSEGYHAEDSSHVTPKKSVDEHETSEADTTPEKFGDLGCTPDENVLGSSDLDHGSDAPIHFVRMIGDVAPTPIIDDDGSSAHSVKVRHKLASSGLFDFQRRSLLIFLQILLPKHHF